MEEKGGRKAGRDRGRGGGEGEEGRERKGDRKRKEGRGGGEGGEGEGNGETEGKGEDKGHSSAGKSGTQFHQSLGKVEPSSINPSNLYTVHVYVIMLPLLMEGESSTINELTLELWAWLTEVEEKEEG